jgi:hypothetical protein
MSIYSNIGGFSVVFLILTVAFSSQEEERADSTPSTRTTLICLASTAVFGFSGEYFSKTTHDAWLSFLQAFEMGAALLVPYALLRFLSKKVRNAGDGGSHNNLATEQETDT